MHIPRLHTMNDQTLLPHRTRQPRLIPAFSNQDFQFQPYNNSLSQSEDEREITDLQKSLNVSRRGKINPRPAAGEFSADDIELQPRLHLNRGTAGFFGPEGQNKPLYKPQQYYKEEIPRIFEGLPRNNEIQRNNVRHNARSSTIHPQLRRHHTVGCITDMSETDVSEYYAEVGTLDVRLSQKKLAKSSNVVSSRLSHREESAYDTVCENTNRTEINVEESDSGTETTQFESGMQHRPLKQTCKLFILLFVIVFVASIAGAGLYSIISCSLSKCR